MHEAKEYVCIRHPLSMGFVHSRSFVTNPLCMDCQEMMWSPRVCCSDIFESVAKCGILDDKPQSKDAAFIISGARLQESMNTFANLHRVGLIMNREAHAINLSLSRVYGMSGMNDAYDFYGRQSKSFLPDDLLSYAVATFVRAWKMVDYKNHAVWIHAANVISDTTGAVRSLRRSCSKEVDGRHILGVMVVAKASGVHHARLHRIATVRSE